jgi:hypothetical protein
MWTIGYRHHKGRRPTTPRLYEAMCEAAMAAFANS